MFVKKTFLKIRDGIKNAKFSGYYIYINTNIQGDFQICISVSLSDHVQYPGLYL